MTIDLANLQQQVRRDRCTAIGTLCQRYNVTRPVMLEAIQRAGCHTTVINGEGIRGTESTRGRFLIVHPRRTPYTDQVSQIIHDAGAAAMRLALGASPDNWRLIGANDEHGRYQNGIFNADTKPDAIWLRNGREVAIEYDKGSYSPKKVRRKLDVCLGAGVPLIWGGPHPRRLVRLLRWADEINAEHDRVRVERCAPRFDPTPLEVIPVFWHLGSEVDE